MTTSCEISCFCIEKTLFVNNCYEFDKQKAVVCYKIIDGLAAGVQDCAFSLKS